MIHPSAQQDTASQSVSPSVLDRAQRGDVSAFDKIVTLYEGVVYRWLRGWDLSKHDAEDVRQQVFMTVNAKLHQFTRDKPGQRFRKWIWRIAKTRFLDHVRKHNHEREGVQSTSSFMDRIPSPTEDNLDGTIVDTPDQHNRDMRLLYEKAVDLMRSEFKIEHCQAFLMIEIDGKTVNEVASQLGMTPNAIYISRSRIKKRLREVLGDILDISDDDTE